MAAGRVAETAKMVAELDLKTGKFTAGVGKALVGLGQLESRFGKVGRQLGQGISNAAANLTKIGVVAGAGIALAVRGGIQSLAELEDATTSVDGAIKQMGLTGQITSDQIATWANEIEANIGAAFDDKEITAAAATLLRFGKTTPQNLQPALQVVADLATKTGSVDSAAQLLAKALADPTKAAGKLARSGVILTKTQQDQIKAFVKAGKSAEAQTVILDALAETTKGAAAASQGPYRRAISVLQDVTEDAQRALAIGFLPVLEKVASLLSTELAKPATLDNIRKFGTTLAGSLDKLVDIARNLPWDTIGNSLKIAGAGAKAVLDAFTGLPPWIQTAVLTGWGLNKLTGGVLGDIVGELGKGLIKGVLGMTAGVVNINAGVVNGGGIGGAAGAAAGGLSGLQKVFLVGEAIGLALLVNEVRTGIADGNTKTATAIQNQTTQWLAHSPSRAELTNGLAGVEQGIRDIEANPLNVLVQGEALDKLRGMRADIKAALNDLGPNGRDSTTQAETTKGNVFGPGGLGKSITDAQADAANKITTSVETMRGKIAGELATNTSALGDLKGTTSDGLTAARGAIDATKTQLGAAAARTTQAAVGAGISTTAAVNSASARIVAAIRPPIVNTDVRVYVTAASVTKSVTQQTRYGPSGGSAAGGHAPGHGPLP